MQIADFPNRIVIELTPVCNLKCNVCPRHHVDLAENYMSRELFRKLLAEITYENPQAILLPFWRGESCLHPEFVTMLDAALNLGLRVHLSTNGHFMDRKFLDVFYQCEFVTFSLHTYKGYQNALRMVAEKPAWSRTITQISFVQSEPNTTRLLHQCVNDPALMGFDSARLYVDHTVDGQFGKSAVRSSTSRKFCPKLEDTFVISSDGGYSRCNHIWETENQPNLATSTIRDSWQNRTMQRIRAEYPDEKCDTCDQWLGHTGGEAWRKQDDGTVQHIIYGNLELG